MVEISEVVEETSPPPVVETNNAVESRSQERMADANEIEAALKAHITRPSAQLHLQNLITKLRKEGKALQRVAASTSAASASSAAATATATAGSDDSAAAAPSPAPKQAAPLSVNDKEVPKKSPITTPIITSSTNKYQTFPTHYFDCGAYNSPLITIYIPLTNIGSHDKSKISCNFTPTSFDLIVSDFDGKSYRLVNDNLEKDIDVTKSKYIVKPNKIIIKLGKIKGEYGSYDHWTDLTSKKKKKNGSGGGSKKDDPAAGIMDLMKDMYDNGDDQMKKMIGETMYKQRTGQLGKDGGMGGMGGLGDMPGLGDMGI